MTPTRRGFLGRIAGGLIALMGGKRAAATQEAPLAVPDEWRGLADYVSKNPYLYDVSYSIQFWMARPVFSKEILMAAPIPDPKDTAQAALDACDIKPGQIYRHYKGGLYSVVTTAIKEDTLEPLVVYQSNAKGTV